jgi:hypothetical protein
MDQPAPPPACRPTAAPTMVQDQAVIGWLATRPVLGDLTRDLLLDVLIFWEPLMPLPAVTAVPDRGADRDVGELVREIDRRLQAHPRHPDDHQTRMVLVDLHRLLGLAWYSLHDPDGARAGRARWEKHRDWPGQLRVIETDTAVELALADLRRERAW